MQIFILQQLSSSAAGELKKNGDRCCQAVFLEIIEMRELIVNKFNDFNAIGRYI